MNEHEVIEIHRNFALERGGILFFDSKVALEIINELKKRKIKNFIIDAFFIDNIRTQPISEFDFDSNDTNEDNIYQNCMDHIRKSRGVNYWEFTFI